MLSILSRIFVLIGAAASAAWCMHHWDESAIADLKLAQARAQTRAVAAEAQTTHAQDMVSMRAAANEAAAQQKLADQEHSIAKEVRIHVSPRQDSQHCITYGFVRVLDAASLGADPAGLSLPAGQSDESCAPVATSVVAASVAANYGVARANAEQLNALEHWLRNERKASGE